MNEILLLHDGLGNSMKTYERRAEGILTPKLPVIVRLDGNSFSKMTKRWVLQKPFDARMQRAMVATTQALLEYCSGSVCGYTQSDEISLVLRNDMRPETEPFLGNRVQKLTSLLASVATAAFNNSMLHGEDLDGSMLANFDCRVFTLPGQNAVFNYLVWRQRDARKNFVNSWCYHSGIQKIRTIVEGLNVDARRELLHDHGIHLNTRPGWEENGTLVHRVAVQKKLRDIVGDEKANQLKEYGKDPDEVISKSEWRVDDDPPVFEDEKFHINDFFRKIQWETK